MVQPRNGGYPGAQGFVGLESSILGGDTVSQRGTGGVADCGALEEDDPATCETLAFPGAKKPVNWRPGDHPPTRRAHECACGRSWARARHTEQALATGQARLREDWRRSESEAAYARESYGPIWSDEGGERKGIRTQRSKGGQCWR